MATSLQSSPSSGDPANDPGVEELIRFIRRARGKFALIIAVCNRADYRDQCIEFLAEQFKGNSSVVALPAGTEDLLIPAKYTAQAGAQLIQLTDLELSTPEDESSLTAVRNLNLHRGDWPTLGCPVILWVAEYLLGILLRRAPDFADWRSGTVLLTPPERSPAVFTELNARNEGTREDGEYNTAAERQARIAELMKRLAPAKTEQGIAAATDHIQALWMRELAIHLILTGSQHAAEPWSTAALHYWEKAEQPRKLAYSHWEIAGALEQSGQLSRSIVAAERALSIVEKLLTDNPQSAEATRDVSVSLDRLGDFLAKRGQAGDADKALGCFTRSLEMDEALLKANPGSAQATRDTSVSLDRLGGFLAKRGQAGDADKALGYFTRCLDVRETLLKVNPGSAEATRDVSVSLNKLGDLLATRGQAGDADKALGYFTRSLELAEALLKANPGSAQATRDVSVSLDRLGGFLAKRGQAGDADKALGYFTRSLDVREALLKANPGSAEATRGVSVSLEKLGDFLAKRGQPGDADKALGYFTRSLEMDEALLKANPGSAQATRDVVVSHYNMAGFANRRNDAKDATRHRRAIYDLLRPAIERGMTFDPPTVKLYETLKAEFAK